MKFAGGQAGRRLVCLSLCCLGVLWPKPICWAKPACFHFSCMDAEPGQELRGLWSGLYGPYGVEMLTDSYTKDDILATKIIGSVSLSSVLFAQFVLLSNLLHRTLTFCSLLNSVYFSLLHKCSLPTPMFNSAFSGPNKMSHSSHFHEIVNGSRLVSMINADWVACSAMQDIVGTSIMGFK